MMQAITLYRSAFEPSQRDSKPYVMLGFNVFAADTDEEAQFLATSMQQAFVNLRTGHPTRLPPPRKDYPNSLGANERAILDQVLSASAIGNPQTVKNQIENFIAITQADELMITCQMFDHAARLHSFEIASEMKNTM